MVHTGTYMHHRLPQGRLAKALELAESEEAGSNKPLYMDITSKAWKLLLRIRKVDRTFLPENELAIWQRAEIMGL